MGMRNAVSLDDRDTTGRAHRILMSLQSAMEGRFRLMSDAELLLALATRFEAADKADRPVYAAVCWYHAALGALALAGRGELVVPADSNAAADLELARRLDRSRAMVEDVRAACRAVTAGATPLHNEFDWKGADTRERGLAILTSVVAQSFLDKVPSVDPICPEGYADAVEQLTEWLSLELHRLDLGYSDAVDDAMAHLTILLRLTRPGHIDLTRGPDEWLISCFEGTPVRCSDLMRLPRTLVMLDGKKAPVFLTAGNQLRSSTGRTGISQD